jgi:hypothetical protein
MTKQNRDKVYQTDDDLRGIQDYMKVTTLCPGLTKREQITRKYYNEADAKIK